MTTRTCEDPKWIQQIADEVENEKINKEKQLIKELFLEYIAEGIPPLEAYNKAKRIAAAFNRK